MNQNKKTILLLILSLGSLLLGINLLSGMDYLKDIGSGLALLSVFLILFSKYGLTRWNKDGGRSVTLLVFSLMNFFYAFRNSYQVEILDVGIMGQTLGYILFTNIFCFFSYLICSYIGRESDISVKSSLKVIRPVSLILSLIVFFIIFKNSYSYEEHPYYNIPLVVLFIVLLPILLLSSINYKDMKNASEKFMKLAPVFAFVSIILGFGYSLKEEEKLIYIQKGFSLMSLSGFSITLLLLYGVFFIRKKRFSLKIALYIYLLSFLPHLLMMTRVKIFIVDVLQKPI